MIAGQFGNKDTDGLHHFIRHTPDKTKRITTGSQDFVAAQLHSQMPVTVVLDNAKYQRCLLVMALAESLRMELLFLPPYSPNLNLIERLWKFVKKQCLYSKYYDQFASFRQAIIDCLSQTHSTYKHELDSLLTLKFQTFQESQFFSL
jgi:transposase